MDIATIKGQKREPGGRSQNARLRREGKVPAVIYGHKQDPETVALDRHDLELALHHTAHVITVDVAGKQDTYLVKEVQYDHYQVEPLHVDLMRVDMSEKVEVAVQLTFKGEAAGAADGGLLLHPVNEITVRCMLSAVPDTIIANVSKLGIGDSLSAGELELPEGVELTDPDETVATVQAPRVEAEPTEGEGEEAAEGEDSAEPEVISRGKAEEDDAE